MNKQLKTILFSILLTITSFKGFTQNPKLIEFGWDYPDVDQLGKSLSSMQNTPFDGICFSLQRTIMEAFDTTVHKENYYEYKKLKTLQWGKYRENFIILRGLGITGGRWFDDGAWKVFTENMKGLSKAIFAGGIKGILFDPEYYYENTFYNPWTFSKIQYPDQSLEEVQLEVKKRGVQFMGALQKYKNDLSFLSTWIASLVAEDMKSMPIQDTRQLLLLSFFEGVLEGKNKTVKVIDGNELAYWNTKPSQFLESGEALKKITVRLMQSNRAKEEAANMAIAQPVFYDGLMARAPSFEKGLDNATKWNWLEENTKYAMAASNSIVWFYSERMNWWQNNVNDTLARILENNKAAFNSTAILKNKKAAVVKQVLYNNITINDGKGYYYNDPKSPMKTGQVAFSFKWNSLAKNMEINFTGKIPQLIIVYTNNTSATINNPKASTVHIKLDKFKKGKIIVLAKYDNKLEASGIQMY